MSCAFDTLYMSGILTLQINYSITPLIRTLVIRIGLALRLTLSRILMN